MLKEVLEEMSALGAAASFSGEFMEEGTRKTQSRGTAIEAVNRFSEGPPASAATEAEFHARKNNLIIGGTRDKDEIIEVLNKLEVNVKESDIKIRQISSNKTWLPAIVTFNSENIKNTIMAKRKEKGALNSTNMDLGGVERNIFINDDLPKFVQKQLEKARELGNIVYKFIWAKDGKVFCRKREFSKTIRVMSVEQVDELKK
ncbi:hypothetical protein HHI36_004919 [Cryptolaemus montrouzieri]|uniref:FP protein C-terminal domain-containing protein n=1 Tax=Cryptolaemus montrouzieri TaxID=559131 RepID=A0ABD2NSS5_9CUCU